MSAISNSMSHAFITLLTYLSISVCLMTESTGLEPERAGFRAECVTH